MEDENATIVDHVKIYAIKTVQFRRDADHLSRAENFANSARKFLESRGSLPFSGTYNCSQQLTGSADAPKSKAISELDPAFEKNLFC